MKKRESNSMKLVAYVLLLTMIALILVAGTYAKYTTTSSGSDLARVAKFGVVVDVKDDMGLFKTTYAKHDSKATSAMTVTSSATDKVVAPGTSGEMTFTITGTPEVATKLTVTPKILNTIHLAAGKYELAAGKFANEKTTVDTSADYEPIKFTLVNSKGDKLAEDASLAQLKTALEGKSAQFAPNTTLDETYTLSWAWAFSGDGDVDFLDTYLGDETTAQIESFSLDITIEQVD